MLNGLKNRLSRLLTVRAPEQAWKEDPLAHPDIQAMDINQIADLPMWAGRHRNGGAHHAELNRHGPREAEGVARRGIGRLSVAVPLAAMLFAGLAATISDALAQTPEDTAAFAMPADLDQWRPDVLGRNGAYRFRQVDGNCQITFGQNRGADAARAAGQEPQLSLKAYIDRVAAEVGRVERVEVDALELKSGADAVVPFVSAEFAYMGKDKVEYHNRISAAWIGDVELLIVSACPASEWPAGRLLIDAFVGKASISPFSRP